MKPIITVIIGAAIAIAANIANAEGIARTDFDFSGGHASATFQILSDEVQVIVDGETILTNLDWTLEGEFDGFAMLMAPGISFVDDCYYGREVRYGDGIYGLKQTMAWGKGSNNEGILPGAPLVIDGVEHYGTFQPELVVQYERAGFGPDSLLLRGFGNFTNDAGDQVLIKLDDVPLQIVAVPEPTGSSTIAMLVVAAAMLYRRMNG